MTETRSSAMRRDSAADAWAQEAKSKAKELYASAECAAHDLFQAGDISDYLDLVCRLNHYSVHNLLLILRQYPKATCLAGFKLWQKQMPDPSAQVLRPEWRGKGLDLIAPFTDSVGNGRYELTWCAVKQFDISQTNVSSYLPPTSPYTNDSDHTHTLHKSVSEVLATEYSCSVVRVATSAQLSRGALVGEIKPDGRILVCDNAKPSRKLDFICRHLCALELSNQAAPALTPPQTELLISSTSYCLYRIWEIVPPSPPCQMKPFIRNIPENLHVELLSLIQRTVRKLEESVRAAYLLNREEEQDPDLFEPQRPTGNT